MSNSGEAHYCSEVLEKRCNTEDCCNLIETEPDSSSNKTPLDAFKTHRSFTFLTCERVTVNNWDGIRIDFRQFPDTMNGIYLTCTVCNV